MFRRLLQVVGFSQSPPAEFPQFEGFLINDLDLHLGHVGRELTYTLRSYKRGEITKDEAIDQRRRAIASRHYWIGGDFEEWPKPLNDADLEVVIRFADTYARYHKAKKAKAFAGKTQRKKLTVLTPASVTAESGREGIVYVLSNSSMPGLLKVGFTTKEVEARTFDLSRATGVPTPFLVEHIQHTPDARRSERFAHKLLNTARVNKEREFFRIDLQQARDVVDFACTQTDKRTRMRALSAARKGLDFRIAVQETMERADHSAKGEPG